MYDNQLFAWSDGSDGLETMAPNSFFGRNYQMTADDPYPQPRLSGKTQRSSKANTGSALSFGSYGFTNGAVQNNKLGTVAVHRIAQDNNAMRWRIRFLATKWPVDLCRGRGHANASYGLCRRQGPEIEVFKNQDVKQILYAFGGKKGGTIGDIVYSNSQWDTLSGLQTIPYFNHNSDQRGFIRRRQQQHLHQLHRSSPQQCSVCATRARFPALATWKRARRWWCSCWMWPRVPPPCCWPAP